MLKTNSPSFQILDVSPYNLIHVQYLQILDVSPYNLIHVQYLQILDVSPYNLWNIRGERCTSY